MALQLCYTLVVLACCASGVRHKRRNNNGLLARRPLESSPIGLPERYNAPVEALSNRWAGQFSYKLVVKFTDEARVRVHSKSSSPDAYDNACQSEIVRVASALALTLSPVFNNIDPELDDLARRAEAATGTAQPDLHGTVEIGLSVNDGEHLVEAAKHFDELACVEYVSIQQAIPPPPPRIAFHSSSSGSDTATSTSTTTGSPGTDIPSFAERQRYKYYYQLDAHYLQSLGANGSGIRYTDCEYGYLQDHVEFVDANITNHFPVDQALSWGYLDHGTAAMGLTLGPPGFGVTGLAYGADAYFSSELPLGSGWNRAEAVRTAIVNSRAGDVVLLEMQIDLNGGVNYGPAELDHTVWTLVKMGTDAGVVIVAAAGNGAEDLDSSTYSFYNQRGDSGAIIVGAGNADIHDILSYSTYGSRVDVQAWGDSVYTAGYEGSRIFPGWEERSRRYTPRWSGTSSASAIVAGAATLFQSWALGELGAPLAPRELRELFKSTGIPQNMWWTPDGGDGYPDLVTRRIGPHINLKWAAEASRGGPTPAPTPAPTDVVSAQSCCQPSCAGALRCWVSECRCCPGCR